MPPALEGGGGGGVYPTPYKPWMRLSSPLSLRLGRVGLKRCLVLVTGHLVDRSQVAVVFTAALDDRFDMVHLVGAWLVADVADATIAPQYPAPGALPVLGQWR